MNSGNLKLPTTAVLQRHIDEGMDRSEIAELYGCSRDRVREAMSKAGLIEVKPKGPTLASDTPRRRTLRQARVDILSDRVVFTKEVYAGQNTDTLIKRTSLPFCSMYVAALQEAGRC